MLGECKEHGYYRGERCPICDQKGKFLMNEKEMDSVGRLMAGILRHFPSKFELYIDAKGWIDLYELLDAVKQQRRRLRWLKQHHIRAMVDTDKKGRFQMVGSMVRATYGHTVNVDPDLPTDNIPDILFFPTSEAELEEGLKKGLFPTDKNKVHLSKTLDSALTAGQHRYDAPIILKVDAAGAKTGGYAIGEAGTTVYTTDEIPPSYLRRIEEEEYPTFRLVNRE